MLNWRKLKNLAMNMPQKCLRYFQFYITKSTNFFKREYQPKKKS